MIKAKIISYIGDVKTAILICMSLLAMLVADAETENYIEYHQKIAKAEEAIVDEKFKHAGDLYEKVFAEYSFYFAQDAFHALQAAILEKNNARIDTMLKMTIESGVREDCLLYAPIVEKYVKTLPAVKFASLYEKHRAFYLASQNKQLHEEWKERFHCEQFAKYRRHEKSYQECLTENYKRLKEVLMNNNQYPGEKLIGLCEGFYDTLNDIARERSDSINRERCKNPLNTTTYFFYPKRPKECRMDNSFVTPTLLHTHFAFAELGQYLYKALENGTMHPRDYMYIYYFESMGAPLYGESKIFYDKYAPPIDREEVYQLFFCNHGCTDSLTAKNADKWRAQIGVCTVQTDERKKDITAKYGFEFKN